MFTRQNKLLLRFSRQTSIKHFKPSTRNLKIVNGNLEKLPPKVRKFVDENIRLCKPEDVHICNGSDLENTELLYRLHQAGQIRPLSKHPNCWLTCTDPRDVARVENKTVICTERKEDTIPTTAPGVVGKLGKWISPSDMEQSFQSRFPGCMRGRTMYVIPYSMGPIGSPLSKIGIQCTDSAYVVASMRIMTRIGQPVIDTLDNGDFIKCLHTVGQPLPMPVAAVNNWPCNPEKTLVAHIPDRDEICSFGSGYGGNSLLGKKCFALRLGSILARKEGWLAEHMLILGITNPAGVKRYVAAAFPSACGKTNLAMMVPTLPGYKVECVGDDIAWMRFDDNGQLRAINPEAGFFGVAPGTSYQTNPNAMKTIESNTLFTNVGETQDGGFFWEGLEKEVKIDNHSSVTTWLGKKWNPESDDKSERLAAHPNSRFCTPARQCPMMDADWESPAGVPIDAILFGGRRPQGVPLVYEAFDWSHGVFIGASLRSETTAAAEHKGKEIMHDPFAMRPFFGYNCGQYIDHWLSMKNRKNVKLPKIYHVNWFRKDSNGKFLWPGFGENSRVLEWIFKRIENDIGAKETAIGNIPQENDLNLDGLSEAIDLPSLFDISKDFWSQELNEIRTYFNEQIAKELPDEILVQLNNLEKRINKI